MCLPVVAWVAGVQKSREIRAVQRQELEEFAGRLETVYKEHRQADADIGKLPAFALAMPT